MVIINANRSTTTNPGGGVNYDISAASSTGNKSTTKADPANVDGSLKRILKVPIGQKINITDPDTGGATSVYRRISMARIHRKLVGDEEEDVAFVGDGEEDVDDEEEDSIR